MELYGIKEKRYIYKSEDDRAWHFLDIFSKHSKLCYVGLKKLTHNKVNDFLNSDFDEMFDKESEREQALAIISFIERRNICDQFHIEYCEFYYELLPNVFATRTEAEVYVAKNCNDALVVHYIWHKETCEFIRGRNCAFFSKKKYVFVHKNIIFREKRIIYVERRFSDEKMQ